MRQSAEQRRSLGLAADHYHAQVDEAAAYLLSRGVTREAANTHLLGYVSEPLLGDEDYTGRLVIPYITPAGVVDIRFRSTAEGGPKYLSRPGSTTGLYNVPALHVDSEYIAVCEGEIDAITAHSLCGLPAVGVPGATNWKPHYRILLSDYVWVFVLHDGDQAGRDFAKRVIRDVDTAVAVAMPEGMDVNSVYMADGADAIRKRVGL